MITHQRLLEILHYDPLTGIFTWRIALSRKSIPGTPAGTPHKQGYIYIQLEGKKHRAHRLAWFYVMGVWPAEWVDHEDGDGGNNRWTNLRMATPSQNNYNAKNKRLNTSGFKGVSKVSGSNKFQARIRGPQGQQYLGSFDTPEEADAAVRAARLELHGTFAHHG